MYNLSAATRAALEELDLNITTDCEEIIGYWNGDDSGRDEDKVNAAEEILNIMQELKDAIEGLEEL